MMLRRRFIAGGGAFIASPAFAHHVPGVRHTEISRAAVDEALALPAAVSIGNRTGAVTMIEFFDYNCGYCKQAARDLDALIADKNLRILLVNYAVLGLPSILAGKVAVAMAMQKPQAYFAFHKALFATRGTVDADRALAVAKQFGGDVEDLTESANSDAVTAVLKASASLGTRLNLVATPSYIFASGRDRQAALGHLPLPQKRAFIAGMA